MRFHLFEFSNSHGRASIAPGRRDRRDRIDRNPNLKHRARLVRPSEISLTNTQVSMFLGVFVLTESLPGRHRIRCDQRPDSPSDKVSDPTHFEV